MWYYFSCPHKSKKVTILFEFSIISGHDGALYFLSASFTLSPLVLKPSISIPMDDDLPVCISCLCVNNYCLAYPSPSSTTDCDNTPIVVDFPASTFPATAILSWISDDRFLRSLFVSFLTKNSQINLSCFNTI